MGVLGSTTLSFINASPQSPPPDFLPSNDSPMLNLRLARIVKAHYLLAHLQQSLIEHVAPCKVEKDQADSKQFVGLTLST